ncbi:hypothetical protein [Streptomyces sp. NPDC058297]|uniref:hypothetical protein n=1 Tax=Streptomyces sp. NPDC058297 TaxID=3346433 RepID=UPI0036EC8099
MENADGNTEAFLVQRSGSPRLSSVEFRDFCIDAVAFTLGPESFTNGKTGIRCASDNNSFKVVGMGFVFLERVLVNNGADAFDVTGNFIGAAVASSSLGRHRLRRSPTT